MVARRAASILLIVVLGGCAALLVSGHLYIVRTASMTPAIRAGDAILARPVSHRPRVGDVVVYEAQGQVVTHRVVEVTPEGVVTKGDANEAADPWVVMPSQIRGRMVMRLPYVGWVLAFLRHPVGWVLLVVVPAVAFVLLYGVRTLRAYGQWRSGAERLSPADGSLPEPRALFAGDAFAYPARRSRALRRRHVWDRRSSGGVALLAVVAAAGLVTRGSLGLVSSSQDQTMTVTTGVRPARALVDIEPGILLLHDHGENVAAFIRIPDDDVLAVDVSTVGLCLGLSPCGEGGVPATDPTWIHGRVLLVRFSRADVIALLSGVTPPTDAVLTVSGMVGTRPFAGSDIVRILGCPESPAPSPSPSADPGASPTPEPSASAVPTPTASPND
jgi:signal peptidase